MARRISEQVKHLMEYPKAPTDEDLTAPKPRKSQRTYPVFMATGKNQMENVAVGYAVAGKTVHIDFQSVDPDDKTEDGREKATDIAGFMLKFEGDTLPFADQFVIGGHYRLVQV